MKKIYLLTCILCCLSLTTITAQSLLHQLGGISTNFEILLDGEPIEVASQYIIERMERGSESAGSSYHLEFCLVDVMPKNNTRRLRVPLSNRVSFLDANGKTLGFTNTGICQLRIPLDDEASSHSCFNFDLHQIPLSVLEHCRVIQLTSRL